MDIIFTGEIHKDIKEFKFGNELCIIHQGFKLFKESRISFNIGYVFILEL
jgi:hypothetical protein